MTTRRRALRGFRELTGGTRRAAVALLAAAAAATAAAADPAFLVPPGPGVDLGGDVVHRYGSGAALVRSVDPAALAPRAASRLRALPALDAVGFRGWRADAPGNPPLDLDRWSPALYVLALVGPPDRAWLEVFETAGIAVVAGLHPAALLVAADGPALAAAATVTTSEGLPVVRGVWPLPAAARLAPELLERARTRPEEPVEVRVDRVAPDPAATRPHDTTRWPAEPAATAVARAAADPWVLWVEPAARPVVHANLAVDAGLLDIAPVWEGPGFDGSGVVIAHNDSGVDLDHPDLPPGAVVATAGAMAYTDSAHGTHTAGSALGRGLAVAPENTSGCGDVTPRRATVRGAAPGALLAANNLFAGGHATVPGMMAWGVRQGALVSTNSWGLQGNAAEITSYSAAAAEVDAAVRDADPDAPGAEALTVFFSAGNLGPDPGTVTAPGTAKSAITVGATQNGRCGSYVPARDDGPDPLRVLSSSSRGPSQGRLKPDLVAVGSDVLAAESAELEATNPWDEPWTGPGYALSSGTSMACALAAGAGAVLVEAYHARTGRRPSPALVKAALVNGAVDLGGGWPSPDQGWGRLDLHRSVDGPPGGRIVTVDQHEVAALATGERWSTTLEVLSADLPLEITLVWSDVPGAAGAEHPLVNDLDLVVAAPDGTVYRGNRLASGRSIPDPGVEADGDNPVEVVLVEAPPPGTWTLEVAAAVVLQVPAGSNGQDFAIAVSGDVVRCLAPPPPDGVAAAATAPNRVEVSWHAVAGAARYAVLRSPAPGARPYQEMAEVEAPVTAFADTSVSGGLAYGYAVRAFTDCWSAPSAEATVTATGDCLAAPVLAGPATITDLAATSCALELAWPAAASPCGRAPVYDLHRSADPGFVPGPANLVAAGLTGTSHVDEGLAHGAEVFYAVRARDPISGAVATDSLRQSGTPSGPDQVAVSSDGDDADPAWRSETASAADLASSGWASTTGDAWTGPDAWFVADEPVVKDRALLTAEPVVVPDWAPAVLEFRHRVHLDAPWDGGVLEYSSDGGRTWRDLVDGDDDRIAADPERYLEGGPVDRLARQGSDNPLAGRIGWTGSSHGWRRVAVDLEGFAGARILLRWRLGCDGSGATGGGWWVDDIRLAVPVPCQSCRGPEPPAGLAARVSAGAVELSWQPVAGAVAYEVSRAAGDDGPLAPLATVAAPATAFVDDAVSGGARYRWAVAAVAGCRSAPSPPVEATAEGPCTQPPLYWGLDAVVDPRRPTCMVDLHWRPATARCPGSAPLYRVYRSPVAGFEPGPATLVAEVPGVGWRDLAVTTGEDVHYLVRALDPANGLADGNLRTGTATPFGPTETLLLDTMEDGPGRWVTRAGSGLDSGTLPWQLAAHLGRDGSTAWFCRDEPAVKDQVLELAAPVALPPGSRPLLELWHGYDLEPRWDGGRLEYSVDDGASWHDILAGDGGAIPANPDRFLELPYTFRLGIGTGNPLAGQSAWTGALPGLYPTRVDLADLAGHPVRLRLRLGCDSSRANLGWWLDDVSITAPSDCATADPPPPRHPDRRLP